MNSSFTIEKLDEINLRSFGIVLKDYKKDFKNGRYFARLKRIKNKQNI